MTKSKKITIEKTLESKQMAAFLRLLASEIEGKNDAGLKEYGVDLHNFNKIKVGLVKHAGGQLHLKLIVKDGQNHQSDKVAKADEFEDIAAVKYRPLKKQMGNTYKILNKHVLSDELPPAKILAAFLNEARQMISFPGFGDDYYQEFSDACQAMETAFAAHDFKAFYEHFQRIALLKKNCHNRYK